MSCTTHHLQSQQSSLDCRSGPCGLKSPSVDEILDDSELVPLFRYEKHLEEASREPLAVLHTSGSTDIPKLIDAKQGTLAACDTIIDLPEF